MKYRKNDRNPLSDPTTYRKLVGGLVYLTITQLDIFHIVSIVSQFRNHPTYLHLTAVKTIIRFLLGRTSEHGIFSSTEYNSAHNAYCDADWAKCPNTSCSTTRWCAYIGNALISWKCGKQEWASKSSMEVEYRTLSSGCSEIIWLLCLLEELGFP